MVTERQKKILYAIIMEFITSAQPVGSNILVDKYNINASPATIRYEMVRLSDEGYISKQHNSAGRQPTNRGYRFFIDDLMDDKETSYETEIVLKRTWSDLKFHRDRLIRGITTLLSDLTKYAVVIITQEGIYYSGLYNLLDYPEFGSKEKFKGVLMAFDDISSLMKIFSKGYTDNRVKVLIGDEFENKFLKDCSICFKEISLYNKEKAILAIVGPTRMNYPLVLPLLKTASDIIDSIVLSWE